MATCRGMFPEFMIDFASIGTRCAKIRKGIKTANLNTTINTIVF